MFKIKSLDDCIFELSKLPGIGRKTASRLAMHIMKMNISDVRKLSDRIVDFRENIVFCSTCWGISESDICPICADKTRDDSVICVVEEPKDIFVIEQTGYYRGRYHVLGGKISPLDGVGPDSLKINELCIRIENSAVREVIFATNPDVDGETTALYIMRILKKFPNLKVTKLASGIPLGTHLEYADEMTVLRAIEGRREL